MENDRIFWLIRCTEHKHAVSFLESGQIRLSLPEVWIHDEIENGKGRGDYFEGVFAISSNVKFNQRLSIYKQRKNVSCETKLNLVYYRSLDCLKIPCFCLFSLNENSFKYEYYPQTKRYANTRNIINKYFKDFSQFYEEPAVIIIQSPKKFFDLIFKYFESIGLNKNEILVQPITYINKSKPLIVTLDFPEELFFKDVSFSYQSEVRIVLNTKNEKVLSELKKSNYIINIGKTSDFCIIHENYNEDMLVEYKEDSLFYNLSKPIVTDLNDMTDQQLLELIGSRVYAKYNKIEDIKRAQNDVEMIVNHYYDRFGEHLIVPEEFWKLGEKKVKVL